MLCLGGFFCFRPPAGRPAGQAIGLARFYLNGAGNPSWVYLRAKCRRKRRLRSETRLRAQPHTPFLPVEEGLYFSLLLRKACFFFSVGEGCFSFLLGGEGLL